MKNNLLLLLFTLVQFSLTAQSPAKIKKMGDNLFELGDYENALSKYEQVKEKYVKDVDLKYNIGICYFHLRDMDQCILYLDFYQKNSNKQEAKANFYRAKAHHLKKEFRLAAKYYKDYLREMSSTDPERENFKRLIVQCTNGPKVEQITSNAIVATLGDEINSPQDEYRVCFNPQVPNTLFFSSNRSNTTGGKLNQNNEPDSVDGSYRSDIYKSEMVQGNWINVEQLSSRYNTNMSEDLLAFFDKGYQMVLLKGYSDGHKEVVKENFDEDSIEVILPFAIEASSNHWDGDHFFITDSIIIFASNRPGGYGGKDLYYSIQKDDIWEAAVNLGPIINSEYDETAPFLSKNGRSLYFSSNNPKSMGGYDIYNSIFSDSLREWGYPNNLGVPINSPANEKDFALANDGLRAFFCSDRIEGKGGLDLYSAYFRSRVTEHLSEKTPPHFVEVLTNITSLANSNPSNETIGKLTPNDMTAGTSTSGDLTTYNVTPIYYNQMTGKIEGSRNSINALKKLLTRHPEVTVMLSGHADNSGDPTNDLYLTVKQCEALGKEFIEEGAKGKQIWVRGCGQNYPIANNENFDGSPNAIASKMNRRINVDVFNIAHLKESIRVNMIEPEVSSVMQNKAFGRYKNRLKGLSYKVQVTETANLFDHAIFSELPDPITEKHPEDVNVKYLVGLEKDFLSIKKILDKAKQNGFDKAKIIPYINGVRISEEDAQVLFKEYEDLKKFLEFRSN